MLAKQISSPSLLGRVRTYHCSATSLLTQRVHIRASTGKTGHKQPIILSSYTAICACSHDRFLAEKHSDKRGSSCSSRGRTRKLRYVDRFRDLTWKNWRPVGVCVLQCGTKRAQSRVRRITVTAEIVKLGAEARFTLLCWQNSRASD